MLPPDGEDSLRLDLLHRRLRANLLGDAPPPRRLGRFEVRARIGAGGMGTVYEGWDPTLSRPVALKLLRPGARVSPARLRREAQALARLKHRHIVTVFDLGTHGDRVFVAMERIDGHGLEVWFEERPAWRAVVQAFAHAARALAYAHDHGVIHGDIKPSNILLDAAGAVKLIDFGLAQLRDDVQTTPHEGSPTDASVTGLGGTPGYAAPEKLRHHVDSAAADQFSLSVALYEGLAGSRPFHADDPEAFERVVALGPSPLQEVPRTVARAVTRGLSHRAEERWPSMHALAAALEASLRPKRRRPYVVGLGLVGALGILAASNAPATPSVCDNAGSGVAERWRDAKSDVLASFEDSPHAFVVDSGPRVIAGLDAYATALASAERSACERGPEPERGDAEARCLNDRETAMFALVDRLSATPSEALQQRAVSSVQRLAPISDCSDPRYLSSQEKPPDALALRAPAAALRARLEAVHPLIHAGEHAEARARLEALMVEVDELGVVPLRIEALQSLGVATEELAEYDLSARYTTEAYFLARQHHLEVRALKIASNLVALYTSRGEYDEALRWGRHAESLLVDAPDRIVASKLHFNVSVPLQRLARFDDAKSRLESALALREEVLGPEHLLTADALFELGTVALQQGRLDEARVQLERVRGIFETALGPEHPSVALANNNLGIVLAQQGDAKGADRVWRASLEVREQVYGPEHPVLSSTLGNLASTAVDLGHVDEAIALAQRGLDIRRGALDEGHPAIGRSLLSLAEVYERIGRLDDAEEVYREALATLRLTLDDTHPKVRATLEALDGVAQARRNDDATDESH